MIAAFIIGGLLIALLGGWCIKLEYDLKYERQVVATLASTLTLHSWAISSIQEWRRDEADSMKKTLRRLTAN